MTAWWDIETQYWIDDDFPPEVAHWLTIVRWMHQGDLRPLAAAIRKGNVDPAVLSVIAKMIDEGWLRVVRSRRGSPKKPETFARDLVAALAYEAKGDEGSDEAFERIASAIVVSPQVVRQAVSRWRKHKKQVSK
jgi:hypothetical protein